MLAKVINNIRSQIVAISTPHTQKKEALTFAEISIYIPTFMRKLYILLSLALCTPLLSDQPDLISKFENYAENAMHAWQTPGMSIALVKEDKVIYSKGFGVTELGGSQKVNDQTIFQIGSISKSFTSALVAMLVDEKKLAWDDHVVDVDPAFMMYDPWVTRQFEVEDLLAQRSGLEEHSLDMMAFLGFSRNDIIHALRYVKPSTSFRSKYAYQNTFFLVAAELLQKKTAKTWEELITSRIFQPLAMSQSSLSAKAYEKSPNASWLHYRSSSGETKKVTKPFAFMDWVYVYGPAGGINSNCIDMAQYTIMQMNNGLYKDSQIISTESTKRLHRPQIFAMEHDGISSYYCLGWVSTEYSPYPFVWHTGGTSGAGTIVAFIPQEKIGIVILTNEFGTTLPNALVLQFFDMYYNKPNQDWSKKLLQEKKQTETKTQELYPPLPLEKYTGTYHDNALGKAEVIAKEGRLILILGPNKVQIDLQHKTRDVFALLSPDMGEEGTNTVTFMFNEQGECDTMIFDAYGKSGYGIFNKKPTS